MPWNDIFPRSSLFHTLQTIPRKTGSMSWIQFPLKNPHLYPEDLEYQNPFSADLYLPRMSKLPWMHYQHVVHYFSQPVQLITLYSLSEVLLHNTTKPETQTPFFILPLSPVLGQQVLLVWNSEDFLPTSNSRLCHLHLLSSGLMSESLLTSLPCSHSNNMNEKQTWNSSVPFILVVEWQQAPHFHNGSLHVASTPQNPQHLPLRTPSCTTFSLQHPKLQLLISVVRLPTSFSVCLK